MSSRWGKAPPFQKIQGTPLVIVWVGSHGPKNHELHERASRCLWHLCFFSLQFSVGLAMVIPPAPTRAQLNVAQHTVSINVEETTHIDLSGDLSTSARQGSSKTLSTTYPILTNHPSPRTISASAEVEGTDDLTGIEISAEMSASDDESSSAGSEVLPMGPEGQARTLLENLKGVSASGVDLTYRIDVSPEAPVGSSSISVTYTVSEN